MICQKAEREGVSFTQKKLLRNQIVNREIARAPQQIDAT